jgi:DNA repair exonuclease SbcCD nuclease subunit
MTALGHAPQTTTKMPAFLHAADLHLDSPLTGLEAYEGAPVEEIRGATRRAFENLVALALSESVDALLLAGDIYDGDWRDYNTGLFFLTQMARLKQAGIAVLLVHGNHDAASQISRHLRLPDNVHAFSSRAPETLRLEQAGFAIHGQSYATRHVDQNLARAYPPAVPGAFNIGLLHTALDGRPGHASYAPCHRDDLVRLGYDYWALGHVHAREVISEQPWVVFPGNLQGRHARETGAKGATMVRVHDNMVEALEHHALDVVRWSQCDILLEGERDPDWDRDPDRDQDRDGAELELDLDLEQSLAAALEAELAAADGRLLAVRLRLVGQTRRDGALRAKSEQLLNQARALALDIAAGGIWIEKLLIDTKQIATNRAQSQAADSLGHANEPASQTPLLETLVNPTDFLNPASQAPALAATLLADVAELQRKLPASLQGDAEALDLAHASLSRCDGDLHHCLCDAHARLLQQLRGS